jgi:site-specific recombinase XerD
MVMRHESRKGITTATEKLSTLGAIELFLEDCRARLSPSTVAFYRDCLSVFARRLSKEERADVSKIQSSTVRRFLSAKRSEGISPHRVAGYYNTLKIFFSFLRREGLISSNPMDTIQRVKLPPPRIHSLQEDDIRRLVEATKNPRDRAIVLLVLDTGLRLGELLRLRWQDIDWKWRILKVTGKGGKERIVPFGLGASRALRSYMNSIGSRDGYVLVTRSGTPLSREGLKSILRRAVSRAGLDGRAVHKGLHTLRHTMARLYLMRGGDIQSLARILGHSSLEMTRRYSMLFDMDVWRKHRQYSPIDGLLDDWRCR